MSEHQRLSDHYSSKTNWLKWGPYLSERQWGTVREDYSENGNAWGYFPHDHARSRVYRWGEDGLAGISDEEQQLCFAIALWNGNDPILKERLFGLTGPEGNHGEDVKELYYYLDNTPTHSYMKYLYKYPHAAFPYEDLVRTNRNRSKFEPEYELLDTGIFDDNRYFDIEVEYGKASEEDLLIQINVSNRAVEAADIYLLPTLWFRNQWTFKLIDQKPSIRLLDHLNGLGAVEAIHPSLGKYTMVFEEADRVMFTENSNNFEKLFGVPNKHPFVKDAFHRAVIQDEYDFLEGKLSGTKISPLYQRTIAGGETRSFRLRLFKNSTEHIGLLSDFDPLMESARRLADEFYQHLIFETDDQELALIQRQALAGMLWTKQFYYFDINTWLKGDPDLPSPPESRKKGRNNQWKTLNNRDILSMPDKWEYPWYAAWDLAFHCIPLAMLDPDFAKNQLLLIMREWYMAPNGQIPAYEWSFGDVNPPVQAFAVLKVFQLEKKLKGVGDIDFLKRAFQKLVLNFTWWVNRKDSQDNNVFEGGFLGLDNIGVFDRSNELPGGGYLEQADGTSWMALFCLNLLEMALEIAQHDDTYEDVATKFLEHFIYIAESINYIGDDHVGLWDEQDQFYYDVLHLPDGQFRRMKVRSLVGLSPLFAVSVLSKDVLDKLPDFKQRLEWFRNYRSKIGRPAIAKENEDGDILLAMTDRDKLESLLKVMLDEEEFLSPYGIRSLSKAHQQHPYVININGKEYGINYEAAESSTYMFGGNSNWRGPVWFPMNYILIEALYTYCGFYNGSCGVLYPTATGQWHSLTQIGDKISQRLIDIFKRGENGRRPVNGEKDKYFNDPHFRDLISFYEYFHGDNGRGVGASHQTGWTGLVAEMIYMVNKK